MGTTPTANAALKHWASTVAGHRAADEDFDAYLAPEARPLAGRFWSPVSVATTAARWLREAGAVAVADVGSGAGKFCVVGALEEPTLRFVGIEQRASLVRCARDLAGRFGVERRALFVHTDVRVMRIDAFDAVYLFNPFGENLYPSEECLDDTVELSFDRMRRDIAAVERGLSQMRIGGLLLTYHGFGGEVPATFELLREVEIETDALRLWVKRR